MNKLINKIKLFLKNKPKKNNLENNLQDLLNKISEKGKLLKKDEEKIISNVFELPEKLVSDIMIPRSDIISVNASSSIENLVGLIGRTNHSRYPVSDKNRDDIIGMVHIKDAIIAQSSNKKISIRMLVRKILYAPESMTVLDLLLEMRQSHTHMAIIVDEHGGVDGLVTIEDLVEEIVGEIKDEHEAQREKGKKYSKDISGNIIINARMLIEDFEDEYGEILTINDNKDIDTMGGLVFSIINKVPLKGEVIKHDSGCEFEILEGDSRRIRKILIRNHKRI